MSRDVEKAKELQNRVFQFIRNHITEQGIAPTYHTIGDEFGIGTSHVQFVLKKLNDQKRITWRPGTTRGITLVQHEIERGNLFRAPLAGTIAAGAGVLVPESDFSIYDPEACVTIPENLIPKGVKRDRVCALRVEGDSMQDDHVLDGDFVIGQVTDSWNQNDMVAAWLVEEGAATLKRIRQIDRGHVKLIPANAAYQPRVFPNGKVLVQARVFAVIRNFQQ